MAITHKYTLMCDEVRQEVSGKFIVIGLYTPGITVPQFPIVLPVLTFFICLESDRPEQLQFSTRLVNLETGQLLVQGMGAIAFQRPGIGLSILPQNNVMFQAAGAYTFELAIQNHPPITSNFDVVLATPQLPQGQLPSMFRR